MAIAGRVNLTVDGKAFQKQLDAAVSKVQRGTQKATRAWCEDIKELTLKEVPKSSGTLASSFFYEIEGSYRDFTATLGYGGNGDPTNPHTGQRASAYMVAVHEDLEAVHPNGKAKFLEDPLRQYQRGLMMARAAEIIRKELL